MSNESETMQQYTTMRLKSLFNTEAQRYYKKNDADGGRTQRLIRLRRIFPSGIVSSFGGGARRAEEDVFKII